MVGYLSAESLGLLVGLVGKPGAFHLCKCFTFRWVLRRRPGPDKTQDIVGYPCCAGTARRLRLSGCTIPKTVRQVLKCQTLSLAVLPLHSSGP